MSHLLLSFLGTFEVSLEAEPVTTYGSDKVRALLAYLAIEASRPHRRAELSAMFWPDLSETKAAHNLSQSLLRLRCALREPKDASPSSFLLVTPQNVQFNANSDFRLDVANFRELLNYCAHHHHSDATNCEMCIQWLRQAADLYRGNLLAGLFVPDSVAFEEWRLVQQEELHAQALETLTRLLAHYERRGDSKQIQDYARRLIALEPWSEEAQLQLMRALVQSGQSSVALRQYESYQRTLEEELGIKPSEVVTALYEQIRKGDTGEQTQTAGNKEAVWLSSQGERRQITTLLCSQAGTEDSDDPINLCEQHCETIFNRFGGRRAQRHGAACLIYFGYPQAFEDAARRAVHSGLAVAATLEQENNPVRIGIHTGMMTIGEKRGRRWQDRDLLGKAPEIARECLHLAEPGEVIVTAEVQRLTQDSFDFQPIGSSSQGTSIYRVYGERAMQSRLEWLAQTQRLTVFSGHQEELGQLKYSHEKLLQGQGQIVLLRGESGIGKSRLLWELQKSIPILGRENTGTQNGGSPVLWLTGRCLPYYQNTNLYPITGLLEGLLGFQAEDNLEARREKLIAMLSRHQLDRPAAIWLLSLLLDLPSDAPAPETITKAQREQMRELFIALVQKRAAEQPLVLVIEDLHWSDPSTADWLGQSIDSLTSAACLTLLTARPNFNPAWASRPDAKPKLFILPLKPLLPEQTEEMLKDLSGRHKLNEELCRHIVAQTDGIPLFIEELTKTLLEQSSLKEGRDNKMEIPASLVDSLIARLDHLGTAKETAQWAAVLGREFSYPILQACIPYDEQRLQIDLARLIEAELVSPLQPSVRDNSPTRPKGAKSSLPAHYMFKHVLVQEAAYHSMLKRTRQVYHQRIAEMLEIRFSQVATTRPELLAQHYSEASMPSQAVDYWIKAGTRAMAQGATLEALTCFNRALELVESEDHERLWQVLWNRQATFDLREERDAQRQDIESLLGLAETRNNDTWKAQAFFRQGVYALRLKKFPLMLHAAESASAAAVRAGDHILEMQSMAEKVLAFTYMEEWEAAGKTIEETLEKLQGFKDDPVQTLVLVDMALYYCRIGDLSHALQFLHRGTEAARIVGNRQKEGRIAVNVGFVSAQLGHYAEARSAFETGLAIAEAVGDQALHTSLLNNLSYVHWCEGNHELAFEAGERALLQFRQTGHNPLGHASCLAYLGIYLEEKGDCAAATAYLMEACTIFASLAVKSYRMETLSVEARCLLKLQRWEEALRSAQEVWDYLQEYGTEGMDFPSRLYCCLADVFSSANANVSEPDVIEVGYRDLMQRAEKISDPEWRRSFLENVAENKVLVERWKKINNAHALALQ